MITCKLTSTSFYPFTFKSMKVLFYSIKGGQGKTTHAVGYAKHLASYGESILVTNDFDNSTGEIYADVLGEDNLVILKP